MSHGDIDVTYIRQVHALKMNRMTIVWSYYSIAIMYIYELHDYAGSYALSTWSAFQKVISDE